MTYSYTTIINAGAATAKYGIMTDQGNVVDRTVYIAGPYTGTVKIEASPFSKGNDWYEVLSTSAVGAMKLAVDPLVCNRLRGRLESMADGAATVRIACRFLPV